jgi:hypothetical protein
LEHEEPAERGGNHAGNAKQQHQAPADAASKEKHLPDVTEPMDDPDQ